MSLLCLVLLNRGLSVLKSSLLRKEGFYDRKIATLFQLSKSTIKTYFITLPFFYILFNLQAMRLFMILSH